MTLKNKFSKLRKIAALSTALTAFPLSNAYTQDMVMDNFVSIDYGGESIVYSKIPRHLIDSKNPLLGRGSGANVTSIVVIKPNGKRVSYIDNTGDDCILDRVGILEYGKSNLDMHEKEEGDHVFFAEAQKRFNYYLNIISNVKRERAKSLLD